jgi:NAD(P)-dependent dehydrogenase (short-subunit alcohol dehydrogenase family)
MAPVVRLGGQWACWFAREGARAFLAGPTKANLDEVAREIRSNGSLAQAAVLDAFNKKAIDAHVAAIVKRSGRIDVSFNATGTAIYRDCWRISVFELPGWLYGQGFLNGKQEHERWYHAGTPRAGSPFEDTEAQHIGLERFTVRRLPAVRTIPGLVS